MPDFNLLEATDAWMTRQQFTSARQAHLYPSEASVLVTENDRRTVEGTCMRKAYLRNTGLAEAAPHEARSQWIFMQGKIIEEALVERWKQMGIWVNNSVKFYWPEYNISGELDTVLFDPVLKTNFGVEVKTFYGYNAKKQIMGNRSTAGFPKLSQLLQTLVYAYFFKDRLPYFKLVYFARDEVARREFNVEVREIDGKWWPVIDGEVYRKFSVNDVLDRYKDLNYHIENGILPPTDFELYWTAERVEKENLLGNVAKTKYANWEKGRVKIGDWQCSYCPFQNYCWEKDGTVKH